MCHSILAFLCKEFTVNLDDGDVGNPISAFLLLAMFLQQRTFCTIQTRKRGKERHGNGMKLRTEVDTQMRKRGEVLKALPLQTLQISKTTYTKSCERRVSISISVSPKMKNVREGSVCKLHSLLLLIMLPISLLLPEILRLFNSEGRPAFGTDSISGQSSISKCKRDGKTEFICSGNDFKLVHLISTRRVKLVTHNPSSIRKHIKL
ncbi:hypothetical protein GQ457_06G003770 [Hibiscus cannabinus]